FTGDATQELAWGSAPATVTYTVYDGNYLNWKSSTDEVLVRKIEILKAVTKSVLNAISDVNVGIMRFNGNEGGLVIKAMSDLDADRASILSTVDSLPAQGNTPLAEFMYEAALYWRGDAAHFGAGHDLTDPDAVDAAGNYVPPGAPVCTKNFNVLLSDGQPQDTNDQAPTLAAANLPDFAGPCDGSGTGACLDDIAHNLATVGEDEQLVTTHTIGFDLDIQSLEDTANESGGRYFRADDVESLTTALLQIFSDIQAQSMSFTAPSVSVNSFNRTQNLNDLYMAVFSAKGSVHWPGNVKKYRIADGAIVDAAGQNAVDAGTGFFKAGAQSLWSDSVDGFEVVQGGAAHELPPPDSRELFTNNGTAGALVDLSTASVTAAELGLTGAAGEPSHQQLIDWMHGADIRDEDLNPDTDTRFAMGDPLHSQPAAVVYGGDAGDPDVTVFVGTNDGYLHAIDGDTGAELWSFVPRELLGDMNRLYFDPDSTFKHYGIDGSIVPVVFDEDNDGNIESGEGDFVYLVFGLRRGGNSYYALDVTDRAAPELLWLKQYPEFGQSWSTPVIALVDTDDVDDPDSETGNAVVVVGGGYDPVHDTPAYPTSEKDARGAGIHMLDLFTGTRVWWAGPGDSTADLTLDDMNRAIPSEIRVIDLSGDGLADRMYAADIGGQIWRFDISNGKNKIDLVDGGVIARLGPEPAVDAVENPRRFYNSPDVAIFNDPDQGRRFISISIGSGYRAHPLNTAATDMFFSVRDPAVFNQLTEDDYSNYDIVTVDDLVTVTPGTPATVGPEKRGWKYQLPDEQAVLANSLTFADSLFIVAFSPDVNLNNPCQPSAGLNLLYQVNVANGDFAVTNLDAPVGEEEPEYSTELAQGGIASSATALFPGSTEPDCEGAACAEPPIFCVGAECFDPGFDNRPVRTLWTQDGIH
ncbi:MAG TPA: hypothetical protein VHG33_06215, partial [Woeseiaceae bacterium]|nr:hypothetical protein [Woeseiaceae bacterium]